jgi:hypothetical protein
MNEHLKVGASAMFEGQKVTVVDRPSRSERIILLPDGWRRVVSPSDLSPVELKAGQS